MNKKEINTRTPSARSFEIVELLINGLTHKQVAETLFIDETTVAGHKIKVFEYFEVHSVVSVLKALQSHDLLEWEGTSWKIRKELIN